MNDEKINPPIKPRRQFEFGLRSLFYATALIAAGLALSFDTIWFSLVVLVVWGIMFSSSRPKVALGWSLLGFVLLSVMFPTVQGTPLRHHYGSTCRNNLKQMILAIMNYADTHGRFPTDRLVTLPDGTELRHSWQIEILPLVGQETLFAKYDFNEAWDGPNNSKLESLMPRYLACPYRNHGTRTPYKLVNGPGTAFEIGKNISFGEINDGTSNTVALIEDHANPVHWMKPGELTAEEAAHAMNSITVESGGHSYESFFKIKTFGCNHAMIDGSTNSWPARPDKPIDPGVFLIDDGIFSEVDVSGQPLVKIKYGECFTLAIYLLLILMPAFFLGQRRKHVAI